ncbi:hypothetical protein [Glycomyces terrestris]|uniref:Uncharacterized protein n=1 Tax=Glycomyces terrestris TaxID=2493553 RepID=A0A426V0L5_9ACTN|nr:hypothetical protein [Glycomyces terrestris]RRS00429.1 hypothetical protein EIW28_07630 [Glycomyces terrestris]
MLHSASRAKGAAPSNEVELAHAAATLMTVTSSNEGEAASGTSSVRARAKRQRVIVIGGAIAVAAVLAAILVAAWGTATPNQRVEDAAAGLAYELPPDWEELPDYDRAAPYTAAADKGLLGPFVGSFSRELEPDQELKTLAESLAVELPGHILSPTTEFTMLRSEKADLNGHEAYEVELAADDPAHGEAHIRLLVVAIEDDRAGVLYGFEYLDDRDDRSDLDDIFSSVERL